MFRTHPHFQNPPANLLGRSRVIGEMLTRWLRPGGIPLPHNHRLDRPGEYRPQIGVLEPRIVLNATAELNVLGQLVLMGDDANDFARMEVLNGSELQFRDLSGDIIGIEGHTTGATGSSNDPIALSDIPSGELRIEMGAGNDQLQLEIPDSLNVFLLDAAGDDSVELDVHPGAAATGSTLSISAEEIRFPATQRVIDFAGRSVELAGNVFWGDPSGVTRIEIGDPGLALTGTATLSGDLVL